MYILLRSLLLSAAMIIYFGSLALLSTAEAGAALFTSPIFILIFSALIYRERVGPVRILAVAAGFTGALLVLRPDVTSVEFLTVLPILAGLFYGLGQLITRHHCADEDTIVVLFWFFVTLGLAGLVGTVFFSVWIPPESWLTRAPFFVTGWVLPTGKFVFWTLIQAFGSMIAVAGLIRGYQISDPTRIGVFEYSFLLFGGFWGWILWKQIPDAWATAGIIAIAGAGCLIAFRNRRLRA